MNKWINRTINVTVELENRHGQLGSNCVDIEFEAHIYGAHDDLQCDDIKISYLTECNQSERDYISDYIDNYVDKMISDGDLD